MDKKAKIEKVIKLLKEHNLKELEVCRFGTYTQYEVAGEFIDINLLEHEEELEEDLYFKLLKELSFVNKNFIKSLGLYESGQNELWLTENGFEKRHFNI